MKQVFIFLFLTCSFFTRAQYYNQRPEFLKANSVWIFGNKGGLDFSGSSPLGLNSDIYCWEGSASVADPQTGQLLFYTNGVQCWNRVHQKMPSTFGDSYPTIPVSGNNWLATNNQPYTGTPSSSPFAGLEVPVNANSSTMQGTCIVPVLDNAKQYYVFSLDGMSGQDFRRSMPFGLFYSIVDMNLDNGLGDIVPGKKGVYLAPTIGGIKDTSTLSETMIAIPGNNCDVWLLLHKRFTPEFLAFHITREGIDTVPVVSQVCCYVPSQIGKLAVSPDRSMVVITDAAVTNNAAFLCRFDAETGVVYNPIEINNLQSALPLNYANQQVYSAAFSPDNSKMYLGSADYGTIIQYEVSNYNSLAIHNSAIEVLSNLSIPGASGWGGYFDLKLYKNYIYLNWSRSGEIPSTSNKLGTITQPNLSGIACNAQYGTVSLIPPNTPIQAMGNRITLALNNEVVYPFPPDTVKAKLKDTLICTKNDTFDSITLSASLGSENYMWDDGSTNYERVITSPGIYWVWNKSCHSHVDSFIIRQVNIPLDLGVDTIICNYPSYTFDVSVPDASYLWQDGSTDEKYTTTGAQAIWVAITKEGCTVSDSTQIAVFDLSPKISDTIICKGSPFEIKFEANIPDGTYIKWSNGAQSSSITVRDTGVYWLNVRNLYCDVSDTASISTELCTCVVNVPNAFTPNGDGLNDVFTINIEEGCPVSSYLLSIYNRFGERVFYSTNPLRGWDGVFRGRKSDIGVYFYQIYFKGGKQDAEYISKGDLTLLR